MLENTTSQERFFSDKIIMKYMKKYGKEEYKEEINRRLTFIEEDYKKKKKKLLHILERINKISI
ncbi:hypothetical protein HGA92_05965 [Candidatus Gracilibacteria bacterium]|nr:hypothetical protein [Candidatus Gracilibacteria bacterium]NUJ98594.1 hypothetical protein [Candidatus Gracilibacteria bacterium]